MLQLSFLMLLHLPPSSAAQSAAPGDTPAPVDTVVKFLTLDEAGARLRSTPDAPIWKLTVDDGEPPVEPIVLIEHCRPSGSRQSAKLDRVQVRCAIRGVISDNGSTLSYLPSSRLEVSTFEVLNISGYWKISLHSLQFPPHVQPAAYLKHLDSLIHLYDPEKDKSDPRYTSLLHLRETIQSTQYPQHEQ